MSVQKGDYFCADTFAGPVVCRVPLMEGMLATHYRELHDICVRDTRQGSYLNIQ